MIDIANRTTVCADAGDNLVLDKRALIDRRVSAISVQQGAATKTELTSSRIVPKHGSPDNEFISILNRATALVAVVVLEERIFDNRRSRDRDRTSATAGVICAKYRIDNPQVPGVEAADSSPSVNGRVARESRGLDRESTEANGLDGTGRTAPRI